MVDAGDAPEGKDDDDSEVASRDAWNNMGERAQDEEDLAQGREEDAETAGVSPFPDVDLLTEALGSLGKSRKEDDTP